MGVLLCVLLLAIMADRKVIIVKEGGGACYTRAGENEGTIVNKAFIFLETWGKDNMERPSFVQDDTAWDAVMDLYKDSDKVSWIKKMKEEGVDVMSCNEQDIREFMSTELFDKRNIKKKTSINNMVSAVRGMFRAIGREHAYGNGHVYNNLGRFLVNSGNPMTTATERYLEEKLEKIMKGRNESSKKKIDDKYGLPLSIVSGYTLLLYHLDRLAVLVDKWKRGQIKQSERIVNLCMLIMVYAFLLHEGSRPIELVSHMRHKDMFFPLHKRVYMLTLVFLSPETLRFLIENNGIPYYVCAFFKGKDKQKRVLRMKSVIPCAYNVLDLTWLYTICMKVRMMVAGDGTDLFKEGLNMTSLRHRLLKKKEVFKDMTFYSFRYGAAEEDKKSNIDGSWTRTRMGHTAVSMMKERYAKNLDKRVGDCPLGMDNYEVATNPKVISLEMNMIDDGGCCFDTEWLDKTFGENEKMKEEFVAVSDLVEKFCENDDMDAYDELKERHLDFDLEDLPLGTHIAVPVEMLKNEEVKKIYDDSRKGVIPAFGSVPEPKIVPELWSFPQVMYGNWRKLLDTPETYKSKDFILATKDNSKDSKKRTRVDEGKAKKKAKLDQLECEKEIDEGSGDEDEAIEAETRPCCADIEPGDHVVILCKDARDACALKLPNFEAYVWIARAEKGMKRSGDFKGKFYRNIDKKLDGALVMRDKAEVVRIVDDSIVHIFGAEPDVDFELTVENIMEIEYIFSESL